MTLDSTVISTQPCPQCKAPMPVMRGFVTWCDQCNWNIRPLEKERRYSLRERVWLRLGQQSGKAMVAELKQNPPATPTLRLSTIAAFLLATVVHGATVLFVVVGVQLLLLFYNFGNWFALLGAIILLGIAWVTRPRIAKVPPLLMRGDYPVLYGLADRIAATMNSPKVAGITISPDYTASIGRYGWQQKEILELGLPLLLIAKGQEKVALIGHELAHTVSGDPVRNGWLRSALATMQQWVYLLRPQRGSNLGRGLTAGMIVDIANFFTNILANVIERFFYFIAYLLALLTFRTSQRAEYRADHVAAQVSGTNGILRLMDKLYLPSNFYSLVQRTTLATDKNRDLFNDFDTLVATLPTREKERLHRGNMLEGARLDTTHPPTAQRIELLQAHPIHVPKVTLEPTVEAEIERELNRLRQPIQQEILEGFRRTMYY